jgi:glucokinase
VTGARVGIDIGGTKTQAVVLDDEGGIAAEAKVPTGFGAEGVIASVRDVLALLSMPDAGIGTVGVGIPGAVDPARGRVTHAVNLGLADLALGDAVAALAGAPVTVENDVNAAALGAFHLLGYGPDRSLAYLNLGTGMAAGIVLDGRLRRGAWGAAGEVGHIAVDPEGVLCSCGQRGCLETLGSGSAVARQWPQGGDHPVRSLFEAAAAGDALAIGVRRRLIDTVASAVRVLVLTVDVDDVVLGGGIASLGDRLLDPLRDALRDAESTSPFLASLGIPDRVRILPSKRRVAAVGAALAGTAPKSP